MSVRYGFGRFEFDPATRSVRADGVQVPLGGRAFDLLHALVEHADRVVDSATLHERVWPGRAVESNNLQVQVWALRRCLGPGSIATVARRGYRLTLPVVRIEGPGSERTDAGPLFDPPPASVDDAARRLSARVARHPRVTLVGGDAARRRAVALALSRHPPTPGLAGTWHVDARDLVRARPRTGTGPCAPAALTRLGARPALLVAHEPAAGGDPALDALRALLAAASGLRLVATGERALDWPLEHVTALPAAPFADAPGPAPSGGAVRALRWRPRAGGT